MRYPFTRVPFGLTFVMAAAVLGASPVTASPGTLDIGGAGHITFDPIDGLMYAAAGNSIVVIDASTRSIIGSVNYGGNAQDLALDPAGGAVLVVGSQDHIPRIRSNATAGPSIPLPYDYAVYPIATSPALGIAYLRNVDFVGPGNYQERFVAVQTSSGFVLADILPASPPFGAAVDDAADRVYVSVGSAVLVYDRALSVLHTTIAMPAAAGRLLLDAASDRLYVPTGSDVTIVDTTTNQIVDTLAGSGTIQGIAIDPGRDRLFVLRNRYPNPGILEIYEGGALSESAPAGVSPLSLAIDLDTGDAWVPDGIGLIRIITPGDPGPADADSDGTSDDVDADGGAGTSTATAFSDDTGDGHTTTGVVTEQDGLTVRITDALDPAGVTVDSGFTAATLSVCGGFDVEVDPGSVAAVTCGSVTVNVTSGASRIVLAGGLTVSIPAGGTAKVTDTGGGTFSVANLGGVGAPDITVTVHGATGTVRPGETEQAAAWDFVGFQQPVDALPTLNRVKAGQAVPLKWRLLNASGAPITNLTGAQITATSLDCSSGGAIDQVEQVLEAGSGLVNLGNGNYQLNWKSPKTYANSCRMLHLDIGDGVTHDAAFQFTK